MNLKRICLLIIITVVSLTSCQIDDDISFPLAESEYEYIEIQGNLNDVTVLMNPENVRRYKIAVQRVLKSAKQKGTDLCFNAKCGAELNISEKLYDRLTKNYLGLVKSGKYILVKEFGEYGLAPKTEIESFIPRLKSGQTEGGDAPLSLSPGSDIINNIISGFRNYRDGQTLHMNDIWAMNSHDWGYAGDSYINKGFLMGHYQGHVFMNSGCSGNWVDQNCTGNYINYTRSYFDSQTNTGFFTMYDSNQLPLATVSVHTYNGYQYMKGQLGEEW
nr:hypothetical protein [uncultured Draconibacterium sp.]